MLKLFRVSGAGYLLPGILLCLFANSALAVDCEVRVFVNDFESPPGPCTPVPQFTYRLSQSTGAALLWTAPVAQKVQVGTSPPLEIRDGLAMAAAKNEFEPVQLVLQPVAGAASASVTVAAFPNLGAGQRIEIAYALFEPNGWPEDLVTVSQGQSFPLDAVHASVVWITVYVPPGAPAGQHQTTLALSLVGQSTINIPLNLRVFNFNLPTKIGFKSQFSIPITGDQHAFKQMLFEHRLTPTATTYPSSYSYLFTWDSSNNPNRCLSFWDEANESALFGIWALGPKYILGTGWNDVGFPDSQLFQFVGNSQPRPDPFCSKALTTSFGSAEYNVAWSAFLGGLKNYLSEAGMLPKTYYYVMNEPQNQADYDLAAHLCRLSRTAAPGLRIAISEEPKPQIAQHAAGGCGYDLWFANPGAYFQDYAWQRQAMSGEEVWFYSLPTDTQPLFNPTLTDRQGMDVRMIPWISWRYRSSGWLYYDGASFFTGTKPGIRAELLREGFEDYEYLLLVNNGQSPQAGVIGPGDTPALGAAQTMYAFTRDAEALMNLRYRLGVYLEGGSTTLPQFRRSGTRPSAAYYINFQDPLGQPLVNPLTVNGKTYIKVGWQAYNDMEGLGWKGQNIGNSGIMKYGYQAAAMGYSEMAKSYIYDDFGRLNLFEFDLQNGTYEVAVAVNRAGIGSSERHHVTLEGIRLVDDEVSSDLVVRTEVIELKDGRVSLEIGGRSETTGDYAYTFLAYMEIVPLP